MNLFDRMKEAWQAFRGRDRPGHVTQFTPGYGNGQLGWYPGPGSADRPDRLRMRPGNERTMVNAVYNKIALDVAMQEMHHAKVDENDFYTEAVRDSLEELLTVEANVDQVPMTYTMDLVMSMFDEGVVAEVPVEYDFRTVTPEPEEPDTADAPDMGPPTKPYKVRDIYQMRIGKITEWRPQEVRVNLYNEQTGQKEDIIVGKREIAIHENPFFSVMNQPNSIFQRLVRKLNILDLVDENNGSEKMNMILQLPYIVRTDIKRAEAEERLRSLEKQLKESKYGIAYVDGTEKIINLNRPIENNLMSQIEWMTKLFYSQLGITQEILDGTADEKTMTNYMNRVIGTILSAICQERTRKFLTREQRRNHEAVVYVQDPLRLIPVTQLADIFDKLGRNAILSPNESRGILGYKPSNDPAANQLVNRNMPIADTPEGQGGEEIPYEEDPEYTEENAVHSGLNRAQRRKRQRSKIPRGPAG